MEAVLGNAESTEVQSNKEERPQKMESQNSDAENGLHKRQTNTQVAFFHQRLHEMIAGDLRNFDSWSSLIEEIERICPDNLDIISLSYDSFLSRFPLCHWYWRKYVDHVIRLSGPHMAVKVFERAVGVTTLSVGLWVDYCHFGMSFYEDPSDVRRLFKRALMFVRKDYLCHLLWNEYIKFEFTQKNWGFLANIYLQVLRFPTEYLNIYYENFKQFVGGMEEEVRKHKDCWIEAKAQHNSEDKWSEYEISHIIKDLQDAPNETVLAEAVHTYQSIGEEFYEKANELNEKIKIYETNIQRRYFDPSPLDEGQLQIWHQYLDFVEKQEDFDWALQVYERCLIPCASYPEFWMRYVQFMESKGGREFTSCALERATQVFLKNVPEIHIFNARFKEQIGDPTAASAALVHCNIESLSDLPNHIIEMVNIQRRLGKLDEASATLDRAINMAEKMQNLHNYSSLVIHSFRLKYLITGSADTARDVLIDGIQRNPLCFELLQELIKFAMVHEGSKQVDLLDSIVAQAISSPSSATESQCLALKDRQHISSLFLEFVDLFGTVQDVTKARIRHVQLFPLSVKKNAENKQLGSENCFSNVTLERREIGSRVFPTFQFEGQNCSQPNQEELHIIPTYNVGGANVVYSSKNSEKCFDDMECEKDQSETTLSASDMNGLTNDQVLHQVDNTAEVESDNTLPQVPEGYVAGLIETTSAPVHISSEDTSVSKDKIHTFHDRSTALTVDNHDQELVQHSIPISFDNLSLQTEERASSNLAVVVSDQHDATLNMSNSNCCKPTNLQNSEISHPSFSPNSSPATDSVQVQECSVGTESASFSSSASRPKRTAAEMHSDCLVTTPYTGEYHHMHIGTTTETSVVDFSAKSQHRHQECSMSEQDPNSKGSHMPTSQADPQHPLFQKHVGHSQAQNKEGTVQENKAIGPVSNASSPSACQLSMYGPQNQYAQPNLQLHVLQGSQPVTAACSQTLSQAWQYPQHLMQQQYQKLYQPHQQVQQQPYSWKQQQECQSLQYHVHQLPRQQSQQHYHQLTNQLPAHEQQHLYHELENFDHEINQQEYLQKAKPAYETSVQQYQIHPQVDVQMLLLHQKYQYQYNVVQPAHQTPQQQNTYYGLEQQNQLQMSNGDLGQCSSQQLQGYRSTAEGSDRFQPSVSVCKQQPYDGTSPSYDMDIPESAASSH